jgi:hypothetical protein
MSGRALAAVLKKADIGTPYEVRSLPASAICNAGNTSSRAFHSSNSFFTALLRGKVQRISHRSAFAPGPHWRPYRAVIANALPSMPLVAGIPIE